MTFHVQERLELDTGHTPIYEWKFWNYEYDLHVHKHKSV